MILHPATPAAMKAADNLTSKDWDEVIEDQIRLAQQWDENQRTRK